VLDNVFYITQHNCKVDLILVVGDGSKILDFFFFLSFIDVTGKQVERFLLYFKLLGVSKNVNCEKKEVNRV
jgi:hypothetical protein